MALRRHLPSDGGFAITLQSSSRRAEHHVDLSASLPKGRPRCPPSELSSRSSLPSSGASPGGTAGAQEPSWSRISCAVFSSRPPTSTSCRRPGIAVPSASSLGPSTSTPSTSGPSTTGGSRTSRGRSGRRRGGTSTRRSGSILDSSRQGGISRERDPRRSFEESCGWLPKRQSSRTTSRDFLGWAQPIIWRLVDGARGRRRGDLSLRDRRASRSLEPTGLSGVAPPAQRCGGTGSIQRACARKSPSSLSAIAVCATGTAVRTSCTSFPSES